MDKENLYQMGLPSSANQQLGGVADTNHWGKQHTKHLVKLKERLERVEQRSDEMRRAAQLRYPFPGDFLRQ